MTTLKNLRFIGASTFLLVTALCAVVLIPESQLVRWSIGLGGYYLPIQIMVYIEFRILLPRRPPSSRDDDRKVLLISLAAAGEAVLATVAIRLLT
jgi:hypothetical protein